MSARSHSAPHKLLRQTTIIASLLTFALTIPSTVLAQPPSPLLPATDGSRQLASLFWITLGIAAVVFVIAGVQVLRVNTSLSGTSSPGVADARVDACSDPVLCLLRRHLDSRQVLWRSPLNPNSKCVPACYFTLATLIRLPVRDDL